MNKKSLLSSPSDFRVHNPYGFRVQPFFGNVNLGQICPTVMCNVLNRLLGKMCIVLYSHMLMWQEQENKPASSTLLNMECLLNCAE